MTNQTFADRLLSLITEFVGGNKSKFADMIGVKPGQIDHWVNDGTLPGTKHLLNLREKLKVDINWLLTGEGEKYLPRSGQVAEPKETYGGKVEHLTADEREYVEKLLHVLRTASPDKIGLITSQIELVLELTRLELTRMEAQRKDVA